MNASTLMTTSAEPSARGSSSKDPSRNSALTLSALAVAVAASTPDCEMSMPINGTSAARATQRPGPPRPQPTSTNRDPVARTTSVMASSSERETQLYGSAP